MILAVYPGPGNVWFPIAFVLIMMVAAALISAAADRMGHRAARRKLRIGSLRPRHVSTLIAIISGVLIALVTVGVMFLVWHDFFLALTQWDNLNGELARVQAATQKAEADKAQAEADTKRAQDTLQQALDQVSSQSAEIKQKTLAVIAARGKLSTAQSSLAQSRASLAETVRKRDAAQRALAQAKRDEKEAEEKKNASDFEVKQKQDLVAHAQEDLDALNKQIAGLEAQIAHAETGQRLLTVGQELGYLEVKAGQSAGLEQALTNKLTQIKSKIEAQGLEFDPQSRDKVMTFLGSFPHDDNDYLVEIRSAENVFEGDRVMLDITSEKVSQLVAAQTVVLDITLYSDHAVIHGLGGMQKQVSVPAQFDRDSLLDFIVAAHDVFERGARSAGFVPDDSGEVPSPVEKLATVVDDLVSRQRPLRIQFVTKAGATALDGDVLAGAELHLSDVPHRDQEQAAPEAPPADDSGSDNSSDSGTPTDTPAAPPTEGHGPA